MTTQSRSIGRNVFKPCSSFTKSNWLQLRLAFRRPSQRPVSVFVELYGPCRQARECRLDCATPCMLQEGQGQLANSASFNVAIGPSSLKGNSERTPPRSAPPPEAPMRALLGYNYRCFVKRHRESRPHSGRSCAGQVIITAASKRVECRKLAFQVMRAKPEQLDVSSAKLISSMRVKKVTGRFFLKRDPDSTPSRAPKTDRHVSLNKGSHRLSLKKTTVIVSLPLR
jgi:hypothetical protein